MQPATLKRGRGSSAVRALGYAILLSARPALFIAVLVFGWLFSGWPETWREVLRPPSVPEADAAAPAGQWWSMSYPFREKITVTAGTAAPASGYSVAVTFGHATLVTAGKSLPSGDDLRVVYWNGSTWVELDRLLDEASSWNNASTKVWFKTQAAIGASASDDNYYLYYGNASAGAPPANGMNVYLFYDDFSGAAIDTSKWTVTRGTTSVSDGILTVNPASSIWANSTYAFGTNTRSEASIQLGGDGAEAFFNFFAARELDTNPWTGNWMLIYSNATSHIAENGTSNTSLFDSPAFTDTTPTSFHTYAMNREGSSNIRYFQDATERANITANVPTVSLRPYAFADAGTGATMWQKYDWWKVRQYVTPEPTSAIAAEEGVGPTYQAAGTVQSGTGTLTVAWPAHAINDIGLLILETQNDAVTLGTNAANWTPVTNSPQGTGTTSTGTRLTVFWSRATSTSMGAVGVNDSGDHQIAQIITFRGVTTSGNPWDVTAGDVNASTTSAVSIPGATTTVPNTLVVAIVANAADTNTAQTSSWANASLSSLTAQTAADVNTNSGVGGGFGVATGVKATAGAYGATTATLATVSPQGRMSIALRPPGTTLGDGTNPGPATRAPDGAATNLDAFTLVTRGGTDAVTAATVTLVCSPCGGVGAYTGISKVEITDSTGATVYGTVNSPSSDTLTFTSMSIPVSTTSTTFYVRITPQTHAGMPVPPGVTYTVTGTVTAVTSGYSNSGTDTASGTVTIDNLSPANVTSASATGGVGQVTVSWANPGGDFSNVVILRNTATISDVPTEGTAPAVDSSVGSSTVRYILGTSPFVDTGLGAGTQYFYRIFAKDSSGNYSATGVEVSAATNPAVTVGETSAGVENDAQSSLSFLHTTSGTNRLLVVGVTQKNSPVRSVSSVTYAGQAMTSAGSAVNASGAGAHIYYLVAPPTGPNTVVATLSGSASGMSVGAVTFTGVNQTTPVGTFASATGSGTAASVTVTSNSGEIVVDTVSSASSSTQTPGAGQTLQWTSPGTQGGDRGSISTEAGASAVTMTWTVGNAAWAIGAVGIKPAAGCSSVSDATYVTAETQGTQATVYWGFTSSSNPVLILRKTAAFGSEAPSGGASYNVNEAIGGATVVFKGTSGSDTWFTDTGLTTGTTYYYKVFPKTSTPCYAPGIAVSVSPVASAVWGYSTTAASMIPPALDPWSNVVVTGSNDNNFHGRVESDGTLKFAPAATGGPIQSRPATVPAAYRRPTGSGVNIAYVTSQDGYVYAVNTSHGGSQ